MLITMLLSAALAVTTCAQNSNNSEWKCEQTDSNSAQAYSEFLGTIGGAQIPVRIDLHCSKDNILFQIIIPNALRFHYFDLNDWNIDYSGRTELNAKTLVIRTCGNEHRFDADGVYFQDEDNKNNDSFGFSFLILKSKHSEIGELLRKTAFGCDDWIIDIGHKHHTLKMPISFGQAQTCFKKFFADNSSKPTDGAEP